MSYYDFSGKALPATDRRTSSKVSDCHDSIIPAESLHPDDVHLVIGIPDEPPF